MNVAQLCSRNVVTVRKIDEVIVAARLMRERHVGFLVVTEPDFAGTIERPIGVLTDRDIVVKALAQGRDPATTMCGELAQGTVRWTGADASLDEALGMMREHAVKRLIVMDDEKRLSGIITEADVATHVPEGRTGELVGAIAAQPPQHF